MKKLLFYTLSSIIFIIFIGTLFGFSTTVQLNENRRKNQFPKVTLQNISSPKTLNKIRSYVKDNFFLRKPAIKAYNYLVYKLFHDSVSQEVSFGKDNWVFYGGKEFKLDFQKKLNLDDQYLGCTSKYFSYLKTYFEEQNIQFHFFVNPNKHHIYPEKHRLSSLYDPNKKTKFDLFEDSIPSPLKNNYIPIKSQLIDSKAHEFTYLKTDTHWNSFGAYLAGNEVYKRVKSSYSHLMTLKNFDFKKIDRKITQGNFNFLSGLNLSEMTKSLKPLERTFGKRQDIPETLTPYYIKKSLGQYYYNQNEKLKIFVLGDSFFGKLNVILSSFSKEVLLYNPWKISVKKNELERWPFELIKKFNPDVVLYQFAERRLGNSKNKYYLKCSSFSK